MNSIHLFIQFVRNEIEYVQKIGIRISLAADLKTI